MPSSASASLNRNDWLLLLAVWILACAMLLLRHVMGDANAPFFTDTDDAMRMVVVRDFLGGQGWYDLVQHRLNTPYGAEIHWSKLIDLPLAGLLALSGLVASPDVALQIAGTLWPLLLLLALLWLSARITLELVGREGLLPALILPVLAPAILSEFIPGRVDHHNVVVVLTMATLLASLLALRSSKGAWLAGFIAASAMAIAVEALPSAVAAILAFGFAYVIEPSRAANLRRFGLGFAIAMMGHLALVREPSRWLEAACDMISPVYVLAALAVGAAFFVVSLLPAPRVGWQRLGVLALLGLAAIALVIALYPRCIGGPYAELDPWLRDNWIAGIVEAKPWHLSLVEIPAYALGIAIPVLIGLVGTGLAIWKDRPNRLQWLILFTFALATALIMLAQVRGARLAIMPAIPAMAWLIVLARRAYLENPRPRQVIALVVSWLGSSGVLLMLGIGAILSLFPGQQADILAETRPGRASCLASVAYTDLRGLPPERIMAPIDLGSHILLETPHDVVAAPYHRNQAGVLDAFRFFNGTADEARAIATERGLGLLVTCSAMAEMHSLAVQEEGTMLNLLANGNLPDWLADVSLGGPLRVYAILP